MPRARPPALAQPSGGPANCANCEFCTARDLRTVNEMFLLSGNVAQAVQQSVQGHGRLPCLAFSYATLGLQAAQDLTADERAAMQATCSAASKVRILDVRLKSNPDDMTQFVLEAVCFTASATPYMIVPASAAIGSHCAVCQCDCPCSIT